MTQTTLIRNPETFELEELPIIEYWTVCYEKDDVDEEGVPFGFYVNLYSIEPLNEGEVKELLKAHNSDYILLDWGKSTLNTTSSNRHGDASHG